MSSHHPNDAIREGDPLLPDQPKALSPPTKHDGNNELDIAIVHLGFRVLAGFACLGFLALAVLFFPLRGDVRDLLPPFGALLGAFYSGMFAITGRGSPWPSWQR